MARWLLDCNPLCGHPWQLGLATEPEERERIYRLRYDVFFREQQYGHAVNRTGRDVDEFDEWCDQLFLYDQSNNQVIGTYRAIHGGEAVKRGGFYGTAEFDLSPLQSIAAQILQGGRTCVAANYRNGLAIQYLSYGMELLLRHYGADYFLGAESFRTNEPENLNAIYSYVKKYGTDPEWFVQPLPASRVEGLREVPVTEDDERLLPGIIRTDLRMGFLACSPPGWDPEFRCYDLLMLGRRDRLTKLYHSFIDRIERKLLK